MAAAKRDCEAVRAEDCTAENCVSGQGERCCSIKNVLEVVNQIGVYDGGGDNHCRLRLKARPNTKQVEAWCQAPEAGFPIEATLQASRLAALASCFGLAFKIWRNMLANTQRVTG